MFKEYKLVVTKETSKYFLLSDEGSSKGDFTCFPNTHNLIPDWGDLNEEDNFKIAKWDYASNGNCNFKVIANHEELLCEDLLKRNFVVYEESGRTHFLNEKDIQIILQNEGRVWIDVIAYPPTTYVYKSHTYKNNSGFYYEIIQSDNKVVLHLTDKN